jgi:hypothetical protein
MHLGDPDPAKPRQRKLAQRFTKLANAVGGGNQGGHAYNIGPCRLATGHFWTQGLTADKGTVV